MAITEHFLIRCECNDTLEGFVKSYKDAGYSYVALLPKQEGSEQMLRFLSDLDFSEIYQNRKNTKVLVYMPEFRHDFSEDLTGYLEGLGMEKIFTPGADFSPMTDEWIQANGIIHKAHIEVDRKGTRAYVASAVGQYPGFFNINIPVVKLNRPFIYAIMHNESGLPVFAGITNSIR